MLGDKIKELIDNYKRYHGFFKEYFDSAYKELEEMKNIIATDKEVISAHEDKIEEYLYEIKRLEEENKVLTDFYEMSCSKNFIKRYEELLSKEKQLQEQEHYIELGKMWDWYYTESKSFYAITGCRLSKKRKYEMLKERVLADYRNEVNNEA